MNNHERSGLSPVWLIGLALCLGVFLATAIPLIVSVNAINSSAWIGFIGSLIGGAIAIAGLFMASYNVKRQVRISLMGREEERMEAELPGLRQTADLMSEMPILDRNFSPGSISRKLDAAFPLIAGEKWTVRLQKHAPEADTRTMQQMGAEIGQLYRDDRVAEGLAEYWRVAHERTLRERQSGIRSAESDTALRIAADRMNNGVTAVQRRLGNLRKLRDEINRRIVLYEERLPRFRRELEAFFDR